jgi:hypothetical protein
MSRNIIVAIIGISILATAGCGHGPIRRFFRGGACNACQPAIGQALWGRSTSGESGSGGCANGICGLNQPAETLSGATIGAPAQSIPQVGPATTIDNAPASSGVIYGQPSFGPQNFDPFSGGQNIGPASGGNILPRPR